MRSRARSRPTPGGRSSTVPRAALWTGLLVLMQGCSFFGLTADVTLQTPPLPPHWQAALPSLHYRLLHPGLPPGTVQELRLGPSEAASVPLPKGGLLPVLAYPCLEERGLELPPAGGLYPLDCTGPGERLLLSWEHGPAAQLLMPLGLQGVELSTLNAGRLCREMLERSGGDPWRLELPRIARCLASGEFRATDIRLRDFREVELQTGAGCWFLESPFAVPVDTEAGQALRLPDVPFGLHRLFELHGGWWADLDVQEKEVLQMPPP
jgi:hypothetical protein